MLHKEKECLVGRKFGKLLVLEESNERPLTKNGHKRTGVVYKCLCDCGNEHVSYKADLLSGKKSCGCIGTGGHNLIDLVGNTYGNLTIIRRVPIPDKHIGKSTAAYWECLCACGNITIVLGNSLYSGKTKSCGCSAKLSPKNNLLGQVFNNLTVIRRFPENTEKGLAMWECMCTCGNNVVVSGVNLRSGRKKSCGCLSNRRAYDNPHWKGYGGIYRSYWTKLKRGAISRGFIFDITIEHAWALFEAQNGKCALTGLVIVQPNATSKQINDASLDRIDSSKGYVNGNVQWVHKDLNCMKMDFEQTYFIDLCRMVTEYAKTSNE